MKVEKRDLEVVLIPENDYEQGALAEINRARVVTAKAGRPSEPDRLWTSLIIRLPSFES